MLNGTCKITPDLLRKNAYQGILASIERASKRGEFVTTFSYLPNDVIERLQLDGFKAWKREGFRRLPPLYMVSWNKEK